LVNGWVIRTSRSRRYARYQRENRLTSTLAQAVLHEPPHSCNGRSSLGGRTEAAGLKEPIFALLSERSEDETAADYLANATFLATVVESMLTAGAHATTLREGLRPIDAAHYLIISAVGMLRSVVPSSGDADQVRRFVRVFVLRD
jgi:hypothetical protein